MALEHDVAELQSEVSQLRAENEALHANNAAQAQELDGLRVEAVMLRGKCEREIRRSEAMYTMLNNQSVMLIGGIKRMESMDRDTRRRQQEDQLGVGGEDASPGFRAQTSARTPERVISEPARERVNNDPPPMTTSQPVIKRAAGDPVQRVTDRVGDKRLNTDSREWWSFTIRGWQRTGEIEPTFADITGNVRTDIVDKRLPGVDFAPTDDERSLRAMDDLLTSKQVLRS